MLIGRLHDGQEDTTNQRTEPAKEATELDVVPGPTGAFRLVVMETASFPPGQVEDKKCVIKLNK